MGREKEDFRANIEQLNRYYPDHEMLSIKEVMAVTGYRSKDTVKKHIQFVNGRVSKAALARYMCG